MSRKHVAGLQVWTAPAEVPGASRRRDSLINVPWEKLENSDAMKFSAFKYLWDLASTLYRNVMNENLNFTAKFR